VYYTYTSDLGESRLNDFKFTIKTGYIYSDIFKILKILLSPQTHEVNVAVKLQNFTFELPAVNLDRVISYPEVTWEFSSSLLRMCSKGNNILLPNPYRLNVHDNLPTSFKAI